MYVYNFLKVKRFSVNTHAEWACCTYMYIGLLKTISYRKIKP